MPRPTPWVAPVTTATLPSRVMCGTVSKVRMNAWQKWADAGLLPQVTRAEERHRIERRSPPRRRVRRRADDADDQDNQGGVGHHVAAAEQQTSEEICPRYLPGRLRRRLLTGL